MNERLIILGGILAVVVGALVIATDDERRNHLRTTLGMAPEIVSEVDRMEPALIEDEVARLSALSVPGVKTEGLDEPPQMGVMADAVRQCVKSHGAMVTEPKLRARLGLMRYLLVFGSISADPDNPLLESRFEDLRPLLSEGPLTVRKRLAEGKVSEADLALIADFHATYSNINHPLFHGLQLYDKTYEALDFQKMMGKLEEHRGPIFDCAIDQVFPPKPEVPASGTQTGN